MVDFTEKGWFVQYIDRDPETIRKAEAAKAKERMDMNDDEKMARFIEKQIERAAESEKNKKESEATELQRESEDEKGEQHVVSCSTSYWMFQTQYQCF